MIFGLLLSWIGPGIDLDKATVAYGNQRNRKTGDKPVHQNDCRPK